LHVEPRAKQAEEEAASRTKEAEEEAAHLARENEAVKVMISLSKSVLSQF